MEEKNKKGKRVFKDDEIPYEVRMKHIIEAYRKDIKRLNELARYAKGLEEENLLLQKKIEQAEASLKDSPDKDQQISQMDLEIRQLKGALTKTFPKRVIALSKFKKKIADLETYVRYLQSLLLENNIPFEEKKPHPSIEVEGITADDINIFAVRGDNENYD